MAILGGVPLLDFSSIGELPDVYKKGRSEANRERTLAELGQGADLTETARKLFQAGDVQGGMSLANLANTVEQQKFNREQAMFGRGISERQIKLQETQAQDKPQIIKSKDQNDNDILVEYKPNGEYRTLPMPGAGTPGNPFATGGMKEHESKEALFADRAATAHMKITQLEHINDGTRGTIGGTLEKVVPEGIFNAAIASPDRQNYMNAKRSFVNALLRRESGAAINASEFSSYDKEYFPQVGDDATTIEQKRLHRAEVIGGLARGAGQKYHPSFTIDGEGKAVRTPTAGAGQQPGQPQATTKLPAGYTPQRAIQEAQAAIASGKDRAAIVQRLQSLGLDTSGL
jgi:hypothetical protein